MRRPDEANLVRYFIRHQLTAAKDKKAGTHGNSPSWLLSFLVTLPQAIASTPIGMANTRRLTEERDDNSWTLGGPIEIVVQAAPSSPPPGCLFLDTTDIVCA